MHIFIDGLSKVSLSNNNLRITLVQNGPDKTQIEVGTLIIPANMAANFVNAMANSLKQLEEQVKAQKDSQLNTPATDVQTENPGGQDDLQ